MTLLNTQPAYYDIAAIVQEYCDAIQECLPFGYYITTTGQVLKGTHVEYVDLAWKGIEEELMDKFWEIAKQHRKSL